MIYFFQEMFKIYPNSALTALYCTFLHLEKNSALFSKKCRILHHLATLFLTIFKNYSYFLNTTQIKEHLIFYAYRYLE